jgi:hypothetical protein
MTETAPTPITPDLEQVLLRPLFIIGAPRSGTTWVQRLMLSHPAIRGGQESNFFMAFAGVLQTFHRGEETSRRVGLANYWTEPALLEEIRGIWRKTMMPYVMEPGRDGTPAALLVEKTPGHALVMKEILALLPEARFLHVIRDSRAVVASMLAAGNSEWGADWAPRDAKEAAIRWFRHVNDARRGGRELPPGKYTEVFYEKLRADTVSGVMQMFEFTGVPLPRERVEQIVAEQDFDRQKAIGGTPMERKGKATDAPKAEPAGFFRKGQSDAWRSELSWWQKLIVWRFTRKMMAKCGYNWSGAQAASSNGTMAGKH